MGVKACALTAENVSNDPQLVSRVAEGNYEAIFMPPEFASNNNENFVKLLESTTLRSRIMWLVVDDGHKVHDWLVQFYVKNLSD